MKQKTAVIIGAGPAGLTAALELLEKTDIKPVIYEETSEIGGISRTVEYKGNRMDIGGHRFFSKSDTVMDWWNAIMPLQGSPSKDDKLLGRELPFSKEKGAPDPEKTDLVMLIRSRLSRIFYLRHFFDYPVSLNWNTFKNLGFIRIMAIGFSFMLTKVLPRKKEVSLEDFFINRFGVQLYRTFFKDYTEKVWGLPCDQISKDWGAQRIKGLSLVKTLLHALKSIMKPRKSSSIKQKEVETSLIEQFLYPKLGPGQLWVEVARKIREKGGEIHLNSKVVGIVNEDKTIKEIQIKKAGSDLLQAVSGDYFFSTMPVKDLFQAFAEKPSNDVASIAEGLTYRDFITVGLLLTKLKISNETGQPTLNNIVPDNWIYVQERDVKIGRIQIFNNWSPYMVKDDGTVWIGLEYFCNEGDELWSKKDADFAEFAIDELCKIDIIDRADVLDHTVIRVPKTYPAYFGTYARFDELRQFTDRIENLFLIGRNGMHRYNNQDHSMLTAIAAVENIRKGILTKDNLWLVNAEEEYHEEKKS